MKEIGWSLQPVKPLLGFALTIAFTSSIWVLLTQLDKFDYQVSWLYLNMGILL